MKRLLDIIHALTVKGIIPWNRKIGVNTSRTDFWVRLGDYTLTIKQHIEWVSPSYSFLIEKKNKRGLPKERILLIESRQNYDLNRIWTAIQCYLECIMIDASEIDIVSELCSFEDSLQPA